MDAFDIATSEPWLITEEYLRVIAGIASRSLDPATVDALGTRAGTPLMNSRTVRVREGVAIIPVTGPIFRYANLMTEISGATSTEILARDLQTAISDPLIKAIILDTNSPGGMATGINELANMIYAGREKKRIVAYGGGQVASAAYWIGSHAHEIVIDETAMVGSIGAIMSITDSRAKDERSGVRTFQIVSSQSPDKAADPALDEGRAKYQKIVDDLAAVFVSSVARARGVSTKTVLSDFGKGGMMVGMNAVDADLADRIGSLEEVIAELASSEPTRRSFIMKPKGPITVSTTAELHKAMADGHTAEEITIKEPDTSAIAAAAKAEGEKDAAAKAKETEKVTAQTAADVAVKAERERIAGLNAIAAKGFETEIQAAIQSGATVGETAIKIMTLAKERGVTLEGLKADGTAPVKHGGSAEPSASSSSKSWGKVTKKVNDRAGKRRS